MTTRYVGIGGNDGNDGLSWANRKLTLNGAENTPVAAGDIVYVGPGTYRELLTMDVSGSAGNIITYIGDNTGEHTDGVGGVVRITGSDNDSTGTRANCIYGTGKDYRTFKGFHCDLVTANMIELYHCDYITVQNCSFAGVKGYACVISTNNTANPATSVVVKKCLFYGVGEGIQFYGEEEAHAASSCSIENCMFVAVMNIGIRINQINAIVVKNNTFLGCNYAMFVYNLTGATSISSLNNIIVGNISYYAGVEGQVVEDYNAVFCDSAPTNVTLGGNTVTTGVMFFPPIIQDFFKMSIPVGELAPWSSHKAITGSSPLSEDFFGSTRPATDSKKSIGAMQYDGVVRETTTTYGSSVASMKLADAERRQFIVPITNVSTTISVRVYREADYTGTAPQMIIRQPGQSARTTTDAAAVSQWNQLTDTFTPAASPSYVIVELVSNNTAAAGNYDVFFDSIVVT